MSITTLRKTKESSATKKIRTKAAILDDLLDFIEDKYLGFLMSATEKEDNIPLAKAKKMLKE